MTTVCCTYKGSLFCLEITISQRLESTPREKDRFRMSFLRGWGGWGWQ